MFALCLPSSCLDNYFGQTECFPTAVALLTDVSLSDRLPRAKPGTLVATSFSAKFYFQFRKGFCFGFVITFAAEIQLYFLVEPGRKTQKVETDIQLMIGGKLNEDASELDSLLKTGTSRRTWKAGESRCKSSSVLVLG